MPGLLRFETIDDAVAYARHHAIAMVDLKFCDLWGRWHHVSLPSRRLTPTLLDRGVGFDASALGVKSVKAGDMVLLPDLTAAFLDPWCEVPTLSFLCESVEATTREPSPFDPRGILRRAEAALVGSGTADRSVWGPEFEFYLFDAVTVENDVNVALYRVQSAEGEWRRRDPGTGYANPRRGGYHAVPPQDRLHNARTRVVLALEGLGVEVKYHHHEVGGPGQCEIEIPLMPALDAADAAMLVKYAVRMTAVSQGLTATFLPKPLHGEAGSGMHFHQCLWRDRVNVFYDRTGYGHLSDAAHRYVAGLLAHGPAVMGFTNPTTNSYRRLVPGFEAPVSAFFSLANRSAAVRIPAYADRPESARLEFRPPDGTGNPYLSIAAQLLAGLDGMRRCLEPGALGFGPVDADIFSWPPEQRARIRGLPTSLGQALDALAGDRGFLLDGDAFSDDVIDRWIARRRAEERELLGRPHPFEYEMYYDL